MAPPVSPISPVSASSSSAGVTVSQAVEAYIKAKDPEFAESSKRNIYTNVRQFAEIVKALYRGRDIPLGALDRQIMRDYLGGHVRPASTALPQGVQRQGAA
jgi:hypothetical protein